MELGWLYKMHEWEGTVEWTGTTPSERVIMFFSHTNYGPLHGSTPASCAATLCAALELSGYRSTKSAAAISYAKYGDPCELKQGAIVVFQWPSGEHHVTVVESFTEETVTCVGGNQGHKIQPATYFRKYIIATRWPVKL